LLYNSAVQQPGTPVLLCTQALLTQVSMVHLTSQSSQSLSAAQQVLVLRQTFLLQVSTVHALLSSHCAELKQQPPIGLNTHLPPGPEQVSMVQALLSLQSPLPMQQPTIGENGQNPLLQASDVHKLPSLQSLAALQQLFG